MTKLWAHQKEIVETIERKQGIIINAGMGTGKTLATLTFISDHPELNVLIVTTKAGIQVWKDEIEKHMPPDFEYLVLERGTVKQKATAVAATRFSVVITNYESVWREPLWGALLHSDLGAIILDESHKIKAHNSKVSKGLYKLAKETKAKYRVCLTGTPFPNSPLDIFGQARFVDDTLFNQTINGRQARYSTSFTLFRAHYAILVPVGSHIYKEVGYKNQDEMHKILGEITMTVDRNAVLDLPPEQHIVRRVELEPKARRIYDSLAKEMIAELAEGVLTVDNVLVKALRLQQLTGGFVRPDNSEEYQRVSLAKAAMTEDILFGISPTQPVVVFARFTEEIKHLKQYLSDRGYRVALLTGQVNELRFWKMGQYRILIVQIDTGSEAIDLTDAHYAIYYSHTYSLGKYEQSLARLSRPRFDTPEAVLFYHIVAKNTIDVDIQTALAKKFNVKEELIAGIKEYTIGGYRV